MVSKRKITYLKSAFRTLASYDTKTLVRLITAIDKIPLGDIKKLKGYNFPTLYRLRVGKYRIIYYLTEEEEIIVAKIDTRGDIYK